MKTFLFQCLLVVCVLRSGESLEFTDQPQSMTIPEGTSIILSCDVDQTQNVAFSWTRNDVPVEDSSRIFMDTSNNLKIGDVSREDAGSYKCVVQSSSLSEPITSQPAVINVTCKCILQNPYYFIEIIYFLLHDHL
nr:inactive tyrosine-protein kinase 7-like [Lytechinus pictus]